MQRRRKRNHDVRRTLYASRRVSIVVASLALALEHDMVNKAVELWIVSSRTTICEHEKATQIEQQAAEAMESFQQRS